MLSTLWVTALSLSPCPAVALLQRCAHFCPRRAKSHIPCVPPQAPSGSAWPGMQITGDREPLQHHLLPWGAMPGMGTILIPTAEILPCAPLFPLQPHPGHRGHPHLVPMGKTVPYTSLSHLKPYPGHKGLPHLVSKAEKPPNTPSWSKWTALTCPKRKDPNSDPILVIGVSLHLPPKRGIHLILHSGHRRPL